MSKLSEQCRRWADDACHDRAVEEARFFDGLVDALDAAEAALEWYASEQAWDSEVLDYGKRARAALVKIRGKDEEKK